MALPEIPVIVFNLGEWTWYVKLCFLDDFIYKVITQMPSLVHLASTPGKLLDLENRTALNLQFLITN